MKKLSLVWIVGLYLICTGCAEDGTFSFNDANVSNSGSIAKFHIYGNMLYVVEDQSLSIFDISDNVLKPRLSKSSLGRKVETIFGLNDILYLGTTTGVIFIDVSKPELPREISSFDHLSSCDPVVSNGRYAFSTLRSGSRCRSGVNVLDIIDIKDISNPILINTIEMKSPYGLGLLGDQLFVGEGIYGMRWLDVSDPMNVIDKGTYISIKANDFVIDGDNVIVNTIDGITQLKISESNELTIISQLKYE